MRGGAGRVIPLFCFPGSSRRTPRQLSSLKLKLLHSALIAFFLLLLIVCADRLRLPSHTEAATLPPPAGPALFLDLLSQGYTILINTWNRHDLLSQSVAHYASCAGAKSIRVVWSQPGQPPDALRSKLQRAAAAEKCSRSRCSGGVDLRFDVNEEDSLNNRFKPPTEGPGTDGAVFSVDDDVLLPCASVELAFATWRSSAASMVGFVPRMHWPDENAAAAGVEGKKKRHRYGGWWSVWWTGTYSMVLSKAAFFDAHYLHLYTYHMPSSIRDYVTKYRNCEDIAMSFLVANATGAPPIWVKGRVVEIASSGISSSSGHDKQRSYCLNLFTEIYGHMPLVTTNVKVIDSSHSWIW